MKYTIPVGLQHLRVYKKARIAQFRDFLCQQLYPIDRVAKDDGLVDLQLFVKVSNLFLCYGIP